MIGPVELGPEDRALLLEDIVREGKDIALRLSLRDLPPDAQVAYRYDSGRITFVLPPDEGGPTGP